MAREFEVVSNPQFRNLHLFLVHMLSRAPHLHRELELGFVLRGSIAIRIGEKTLPLRARDGYLIDPLTVHEFGIEGGDALILVIQISPNIMDSFFSTPPSLRFEDCADLHAVLSPQAYRALFYRCIALARCYIARSEGYAYGCFSHTAQLLAALERELPAASMSTEAWRPMQRRLERVLAVTDYINENFQRKLLLSEIAAREGVTMTYMSHLFKEAMGMSFQEYLKQRRFEHARSLILDTQRTMLDISLESGFSDVRYMIAMFEAEFGCTPRAYRRRAGPPPAGRRPTSGSVERMLPQEEALRCIRQFVPELDENAPRA